MSSEVCRYGNAVRSKICVWQDASYFAFLMYAEYAPEQNRQYWSVQYEQDLILMPYEESLVERSPMTHLWPLNVYDEIRRTLYGVNQDGQIPVIGSSISIRYPCRE